MTITVTALTVHEMLKNVLAIKFYMVLRTVTEFFYLYISLPLNELTDIKEVPKQNT